ncbi:MAG: hypothetical protein ACOC8E_01935, partial [Planctomycetota bacterium]
MRKWLTLAVAVLLAAGPARGAAFRQKPSAAKKDGKVVASFAVDEPTDVAVFVENEDGDVVRHLAAGVLGPNAPAPLKADSLEQSLVWDGTDDAGEPVPAGRYTVRVGLGTKATFERNIGHDRSWLGNIYAMAVNRKGELFVLCSRGICVLDRRGNYLRQIVPAPKTLSADALGGREPVVLKDGTVYFQKGCELPGSIVGSMALTPGGELVLPGPGRYARNVTIIGTDGSVRSDAFDKKLTIHADYGYLFLTASPDGKLVYMAGAQAGYRGDDARKLDYRHAVYKLPLDSDGPAEIFTGDDENTGGPAFKVNKPKGLACDPDGRLYVCNYGGHNVAVYSAGGGVVKSIQVKWPQQVAVHPKTGQVYVLAGYEKGRYKYGYNYPAKMREAKLYRFSKDGQQEAMLEFQPPWVKKRKEGTNPEFKLRMAVDCHAPKPIIWVGVHYPGAQWAKWNLKRIVDEGDEFGEPEDAMPKPDEDHFAGGVRQIFLDRERDILYVNRTSKLMRFTGDGKRIMPSITFRDPKTDKKQYICEAYAGPGGSIYGLLWFQWGYKDNFIRRLDRDGEPQPLPAEKDGRIQVRHCMKGGGSGSTRGFTVDPKGNIYAMHYDHKFDKGKLPPWDRSWNLHTAVARFDPDGKLVDPRLVGHLRAGAQCVRVDRAGNVFVADNVMPLGVTFPKGFRGVVEDPLKRMRPAMLPDGRFDPLLRHMGSLFKFGPRGGRMV